MFRLTYKDSEAIIRKDYTDINTLMDVLVGILNDESEENKAYDWISKASFGQTYDRQSYMIECVDEAKERKMYTDYAQNLSNKINVEHSFVKYNSGRYYWRFWILQGVLIIDATNRKYYFSYYNDDLHCDWEFSSVDIKEFTKTITEEISKIKKEYKFENKKLLQAIADRITQETGVENKFIGYDNDSLTWDFGYGVSYMKNTQGKKLFFALNESDGREIQTISDTDEVQFILRVVGAIKKVLKQPNGTDRTSRVVPNKEIIYTIKNAISAKQEFHGRIYNDGCWWIDIERHPYGQIRFWVGFEDKRDGNCRSSICSIYRRDNEIITATDGIVLKKSVKDKLISTYKALEKEKIL